MKTNCLLFLSLIVWVGWKFDLVAAQTNAPTPWDQIGVRAGAEYQGDGLALASTASGARISCVFQRLEGEATREGLWLTSVAPGQPGDRFRLMAATLGRDVSVIDDASSVLAGSGAVEVDNARVRFIRSRLIEEYSVSPDGVRQDFVLPERPVGEGRLRVELVVTGAAVKTAAHGVQLVLGQSRRKITYGRLLVTDAAHRELPARLEVQRSPELRVPVSEFALTVVVDDADAEYPVRIDPTFSDANWISMNPGIPGANGTVNAATVDHLGNLYVGGDFSMVGEVAANGIAKWDGSRWNALSEGIRGEVNRVLALAVSGTNLYVGGWFTNAGGVPANNIARWDGSAWSTLGEGMNGGVAALVVSGGKLFAAGQFTTAGGAAARNIAKWSGSSWSALGDGLDRAASALAVSGTDLYAGGFFSMAGGIPANHVAHWDGSRWSPLGEGISGDFEVVYALAASGSDVYAAGTFTMAGGVAARNIARWDGSRWNAMGEGLGDWVHAVAVSGKDVYAGGEFPTIPDLEGVIVVNGIAKWDGSQWRPLEQGVNPWGGPVRRDVKALAVSGDRVFAGGIFEAAGGVAAKNIAQWDGTDWSALGKGMEGPSGLVNALVVSGRDVYVGGEFKQVGGVPANSVAQWKGGHWNTLGQGVKGDRGTVGSVWALAASDGDLYVGGRFASAGGIPAMNIAKWNGQSWSALSEGVGNQWEVGTLALAAAGGDVYVGGGFTMAGGLVANGIAKWDGSRWSPLGEGTDGWVRALAVSGGDLYAGGSFTTAGGIAANGIAKWDGNHWSALGEGINGDVIALAMLGGDLFAGGSFATAGGMTANGIAKWDRSRWTALGLGFNDGVYALAVSGDDLLAAGGFITAGGITANRLARWNGTDWSALGSGTDNTAYALAVSGNDLLVGGGFLTAGGKVSAYLARARLSFMPDQLALRVNVPGAPTNTLTFSGVPGFPYFVEYATNLSSGPWSRFSTNAPAADGVGKVLDPDATNPQRHYRVGYEE